MVRVVCFPSSPQRQACACTETLSGPKRPSTHYLFTPISRGHSVCFCPFSSVSDRTLIQKALPLNSSDFEQNVSLRLLLSHDADVLMVALLVQMWPVD